VDIHFHAHENSAIQLFAANVHNKITVYSLLY